MERAKKQKYKETILSTSVQVNENNLKRAFLLHAIISLLLGVVLLVWPGKSTIFVAWISLLLLAASALYNLISVFGANKTGGARFLHLLSGLIAALLVYWVFAFGRSEAAVSVADALGVNPVSLGAALLLAFTVGINWIITGAVKVFLPILDKATPNRGLTILSGILSLIAGVFIVSYPVSITVFAIVAGAIMLVLGTIEMIIALKK
jgi:uncharacterized membrane protein HdeD (DUF308 family)